MNELKLKKKAKLSAKTQKIKDEWEGMESQYRFISHSFNCVKIHIHTPDDGMFNRSVGCLVNGRDEALKEAILLRNKVGKELWGSCWKTVLNSPRLFERLPHTLEPDVITKSRKLLSGEIRTTDYYIVRWKEVIDGKLQSKSRLFSFNNGNDRLAAYSKAKAVMMTVNRKYIPILKKMNRMNIVGNK